MFGRFARAMTPRSMIAIASSLNSIEHAVQPGWPPCSCWLVLLCKLPTSRANEGPMMCSDFLESWVRKMGLMSRALWHVNRSPLRYAVKSGVSAWHLGEKRERRRQAQLLNVSAAERNKAEELNRNGYAVVTELMDPAIQSRFADAGMARLADIESCWKPSKPRTGRSSGFGCSMPR